MVRRKDGPHVFDRELPWENKGNWPLDQAIKVVVCLCLTVVIQFLWNDAYGCKG
jgi:hypothetical protein